MKPQLKTTLAAAIVPTVYVSLLFYVLLGHRRDYLGHYAAGYGGTLSAIAIVFAAIPATKFRQIGSWAVVPCTILCIAAGTVTEATVFRLAKFDEIDYCNQNLGAVVAGLATIYIAGNAKPSDVALRCVIAIGAISLLIGAYLLSPRSLSILALTILGVSFAGANIWFAAVRSTIPLELNGSVTQTQRLIEKTPGVDDVYIVTLDLDRRIQVDGPVFEAVTAHQSVKKRAWSRIIEIDGKNIALGWSADYRGMLWAMPLTVAVCVFLGMMAVERPLRKADQQSDARETSAQSPLKSQSTPRSP